ncbi:hypothetical protein QOZ80_1AG0046330 [Eleusine coracana subsp. coracana]|nr:hypothetical protein QOZ80_1AG0046330 [Eleusine coracana subsp. coracana]
MIKEACFTTEVLDGFDVQRTSGYAESERRYGYLTCSIIEYFKANFSKVANMSRICPTYDEFVGKCSDLAKEPVSQIFALQLMQVPQVTEEAALGVIELYPTLLSLAQAYSKLDGDTRAQEEMLQNKNQMKWQSLMNEPDGLSATQSLALANAKRSISCAQERIRTLDDFKEIKGVGRWLTFHMKEFFGEHIQDLSPAKADVARGSGNQLHVSRKETRGSKPYRPRKNTAAYAILITLLRENIKGKSEMLKQELIDAAEASGLSQEGISRNKSKARQSYGKDWYNGWSCMKTLISHKLVSKQSCPAKYMLTEEGEKTARDCLSQPGFGDSEGPIVITSIHNTSVDPVAETMSGPFMTIRRSRTSVARHSPKLVWDSSPKKVQSSYKAQVQTKYSAEGIIFCDSDSEEAHRKDSPLKDNGPSAEFSMLHRGTSYMSNAMLAMPPRQSNENFLEAYEVVLILDDREKFGSTRKVADNIRAQIHQDVSVEVRRLPIGDSIWVARRREDGTEYVLDYIVERKNLLDLDDSITDNRYKDQKLRLKRCGLRKVIYLVEGDPKSPHVSEKAKTACFTTEILDGFDILRTSGYAETERQYVYLTSSIIEYCNTNFSNLANSSHVCLTYNEFERRCKDFDKSKSTVSEIFALQLMQVPQLTEEAALAVIELYPTLISLAQAYLELDGDTRAQEEMLQKKSKKVNAGASRNIFKLVWAEG